MDDASASSDGALSFPAPSPDVGEPIIPFVTAHSPGRLARYEIGPTQLYSCSSERSPGRLRLPSSAVESSRSRETRSGAGGPHATSLATSTSPAGRRNRP
jgi:hypothetical protein